MEWVSLALPCSAASVAMQKVQSFLATQALSSMENGQHHIEGEDFFVNIFGYTTTVAEERIWEAHRDYIDIHVVIEGSEVVRSAPINECEIVQYHAERDYVEIKNAPSRVSAVLDNTCATVFYPEDGHQTGLMVDNQPQAIRKAVFKLRL